MITREEAYAWLERQVEACNMMSEPLGRVENMSFYPEKRIQVYCFQMLVDALGRPYVRSDFGPKIDKLHFRYKGVEFFGITHEKRIGKKEVA